MWLDLVIYWGTLIFCHLYFCDNYLGSHYILHGGTVAEPKQDVVSPFVVEFSVYSFIPVVLFIVPYLHAHLHFINLCIVTNPVTSNSSEYKLH